MRFPEFSGEWEKTSIGNCCYELEYGMNAPSKNFDGINKYIRITDIDEQTAEYKQDFLVSPDAPLEDKYIVKDGDILFARTGASTGKTYIYNPQDGKIYYAGFLIRANVKNENNPKFVFYQTKTYRYKKWISIMSMRSGQPGINSQEYASYKFLIPIKAEQDKISCLINLLDLRIQTQRKIIEDLKKLKKEISKRIFSKQINFSKQKFLGDICTITTGKLDANAMTKNGKYLFFTCAYENYKTDTYAFEGKALLISGNGEVGLVKKYNGKFNAYQRTYVLQNFIENMDYIKCYIEYFLPKRIQKEKNVGAMPYIVLSTLYDMNIAIPSIETQNQISKIIDTIINFIECEYDIQAKYELQKQFLLRRMFI